MPEHVGHALLDADLLPSAYGFGSGDVHHGAQVIPACLGGEPAWHECQSHNEQRPKKSGLILTIFLMNNRLPAPPLTLPMIPNPLIRPLDRLRPPVRVRMERSKIDILQRELRVEVSSVTPVVRPVVRLPVEPSFPTPRHQVVRVKALDVRAHLVDPGREQVRIAVVAARQVAHAVCAAARLVAEFPGHDGGGVAVACDEFLDVVLVCFFDLGEAVELDSG